MENKKSIYQKLFDIKKEAITLKKDTEAFNYKYATLGQIQDKLSPILEKNNILIIHKVESQKVCTIIRDIESGEEITSSIDIGEVKSSVTGKDKKGNDTLESNTLDPQGVGSIITYYRRYNLVALFDLEIEDDDGVSGSAKAKGKLQTGQENRGVDETCEIECKGSDKKPGCGTIEKRTIINGAYGPYVKCSCGAYTSIKK